MFCSLTNHVIKKTKETVEGHMKGKKFKRAQGMFIYIYIYMHDYWLDDVTQINHLSDLIISCVLITPSANDSQ